MKRYSDERHKERLLPSSRHARGSRNVMPPAGLGKVCVQNCCVFRQRFSMLYVCPYLPVPSCLPILSSVTMPAIYVFKKCQVKR